MNGQLVPKDFVVPRTVETASFRLRMLTINDVVKDYDAVMTSIDHLQGLFGRHSSWPSPDLSLEQDLIDLGWHQKEFQKRSSFAYTVMTPDESICLGCLYIYPPGDETPDDCDAEVFFWARQSHLESGLEQKLFTVLKTWLDKSWPFQKVDFPGRDRTTGDRLTV